MLPAVWTDQHVKWVGKGLKKFLWPLRYISDTGGWSRSENLPNQLTVLRLFMGLFFLLILSLGFFGLALTVYIPAMTTDVLDGYLARRNGQISNFGRILDPLADKLIICGGLSLLLLYLPIVRPWMVITIIARELLVSLLRGYAELNGVAFPSNIWGKVKMSLQSFVVGLLVFVAGPAQGYYWVLTVSEALLWFTVMLTLLSGLAYFLQAWQFLRARTSKKPYGVL